MKGTILTLLIITLLSSSCTFDTANPKVSDNIEDSKEKGVFIKEYYAIQQVPEDTPSYIFGDVWVEHTWYHDISSGRYNRRITNRKQLCFQIQQDLNMHFRYDNVLNWAMKDTTTGDYVGLWLPIYRLGLDTSLRDSIVLDLYQVDDTIDQQFGTFIFIAKE